MRSGLLEVARLLRDYPALVHLESVSPLLPTMSAIKRTCQEASAWDSGCDAAIADVFHAALYGLTINQVSKGGGALLVNVYSTYSATRGASDDDNFR